MALGRVAIRSSNSTIRPARAFALLLALVLAAGQGRAQAAPPELQARLDEAASALEDDPLFKGAPREKLRDAVEFIVGNVLLVVTHELSHGIIAEMRLPVLGREEDAADTFAALTGLKVANSFSEGVLRQAAKGWFLSARRERAAGIKLNIHGEHGLSLQRAYHIVCLMVGSDPTRFKDLAQETGLPAKRQQSCEGDYERASWSWEALLKPHLRAPD